MEKEKATKKNEATPLKKRIGAAYMRSTDSIMTKDTSAFLSDHGFDTVNRSAETCTTDSFSGSSSEDEDITSSSSSSSKDDSTTQIKEETLTAHLRNTADTRSITTEDVQRKNNGYSWFQPYRSNNGTPRANNYPQSPTDDSVGAVKRSIKSKFDYIRKNQRFSSSYHDPPSDKSMMSSHSIKAVDAGSLLKGGGFASALRKKQLIEKKNELAKSILKRRSNIMFRPGYDP